MSDTNKYAVNRNGVSFPLTKQVFGKMSDHAGQEFYAPEAVEATAEEQTLNGEKVLVVKNYDFLKWVGLGDLAKMSETLLRRIFAKMWTTNIEDNKGTLNLEQFLADAADFSAGEDTLSDINEELDSLQALQQSFALDEAFGQTTDGTVNGPKTEKAQELEMKIRETAAKMKPLREKKAIISAKYAARVEARKAKKAAAQPAQEAVAA